jgi:hypothetical protein
MLSHSRQGNPGAVALCANIPNSKNVDINGRLAVPDTPDLVLHDATAADKAGAIASAT